MPPLVMERKDFDVEWRESEIQSGAGIINAALRGRGSIIHDIVRKCTGNNTGILHRAFQLGSVHGDTNVGDDDHCEQGNDHDGYEKFEEIKALWFCEQASFFSQLNDSVNRQSIGKCFILSKKSHFFITIYILNIRAAFS